MRILYVDDDPLWLGLLKEMFGEVGGDDMRVATVLTGSQAIRMARRYPFDLVVVDLNLCDMLGLEVIEQIHELKPDVHIAALTGSRDLATAAKSRSAGAQTFLGKPVTLETLADLVTKVQNASVRQAPGGALAATA